MRYDVFLSHANSDNRSGFIDRLVKAICDQGSRILRRALTVFTDSNIPTGAVWESALFQKLLLSRVLVPVISESWKESQWSNHEWAQKWSDLAGDFFYSNQTCILPVTYNLDDAARKRIGDQQSALQYSRGIFS